MRGDPESLPIRAMTALPARRVVALSARRLFSPIVRDKPPLRWLGSVQMCASLEEGDDNSGVSDAPGRRTPFSS